MDVSRADSQVANNSASVDNLYNVTPQLNELAVLFNSEPHASTLSVRVPLRVQEAINTVLTFFTTEFPFPTTAQERLPSQPLLSPSFETHSPTVRFNVFINRKTTLEKLYTYHASTTVEYPETSSTGSVGHLLPLIRSGTSWVNPARNIAYSQGEPRGTSGKNYVECPVLIDDSGKPVPCRTLHSTCMLPLYTMSQNPSD